MILIDLELRSPPWRQRGAKGPLIIRLERGADQAVELQRKDLSLPSLPTSLRGRWRGNCHPGELGAALRKLGSTRQRRWHDERGFQAVWRR